MIKILVVEDSRDTIKEITSLLQSHGYETVTAKNGVEGLKSAKEALPDLIVSAMEMPNMDGLKMVRRIRADYELMTVPVIFLTANKSSRSAREGMLAGADEYLTKPLDPKELLEAVADQLRKKEKMDAKLDSIIHNIALHIPHQLRTPLVSIMGFTSLINDEAEQLSRRELVEMLNRIKISSERLYRSSAKLMRFNEALLLSANKYNNSLFSREHYSARPVTVRNIAMEMAGRFRRASDLKMYLDDAKLQISVEHLRVISREIIENAFSYTDKGTKITLRSDFKDGRYNIDFIDEGKNFPAGGLKIPEPLEIKTPDDYANPDIGLGLVTVKALADLYDLGFSITREGMLQTTVRVSFKQLGE